MIDFTVKGGELFAHSKFTIERVSRGAAQALSQESCEEWCVEHRSQEAMVRFKE